MLTEQTAAVARRHREVNRTGDFDAITEDYTEGSSIDPPKARSNGSNPS